MSSAVSEPATKTGRQQQLGIAGLKYDLKFNLFFFFSACKTVEHYLAGTQAFIPDLEGN